MNLLEVIVFCFLAAAGLALVVVLCGAIYEVQDRVRGVDVEFIGRIAEKSYAPPTSGVGVGPNIGGNGGATVVVTSTSEVHTLLVDVEGFDEYQRVEVSAKDYKKARTGGLVILTYTRGASGKLYGPTWYELGGRR